MVDHILHFQKRKLARCRVVTSFGDPAMEILLAKLNAQEWSNLFLQGDFQWKFIKTEVYEFYTNGIKCGELFFTTVRGVPINLVAEDLTRILNISIGGWGYYVKFEYPPLDNLASSLDISKKFSIYPHLIHHRRVFKQEMSLFY